MHFSVTRFIFILTLERWANFLSCFFKSVSPFEKIAFLNLLIFKNFFGKGQKWNYDYRHGNLAERNYRHFKATNDQSSFGHSSIGPPIYSSEIRLSYRMTALFHQVYYSFFILEKKNMKKSRHGRVGHFGFSRKLCRNIEHPQFDACCQAFNWNFTHISL